MIQCGVIKVSAELDILLKWSSIEQYYLQFRREHAGCTLFEEDILDLGDMHESAIIAYDEVYNTEAKFPLGKRGQADIHVKEHYGTKYI